MPDGASALVRVSMVCTSYLYVRLSTWNTGWGDDCSTCVLMRPAATASVRPASDATCISPYHI
jgi:hypothetical protein